MPILRGFLTLLLFLAFGECLQFIFDWPVSGGVLGMILLTFWLMVSGGANEALSGASQALISILILLIMPGVVGVFFLGDRFDGQWLAVATALVAGTFLSVLSTLLLLKAMVPQSPDRPTAMEADDD